MEKFFILMCNLLSCFASKQTRSNRGGFWPNLSSNHFCLLALYKDKRIDYKPFKTLYYAFQ